MLVLGPVRCGQLNTRKCSWKLSPAITTTSMLAKS